MGGTVGSVPTIDLTPWFAGSDEDRRDVADQVDKALQSVGFFLLTGHGVTADERAGVRAAARRFFALPDEVKRAYAVTVGGRGWLPPGVEANGYAEGTPTPPDLKESFAVGADTKTGVPDVDEYWFPDNVFPEEVAELRACVTGYLARMRALADELLTVAAVSLGQPAEFFTRHTGHSTYTMNINWYPPMSLAGPPADGQFRIGPHTDFGDLHHPGPGARQGRSAGLEPGR